MQAEQGAEQRVPAVAPREVDRYPYGEKRGPLIEKGDRWEALLAVAADEARHVQRLRRGRPGSEVGAERFAVKALARCRGALPVAAEMDA